MQCAAILKAVIMIIFIRNSDIFLIFAQNIVWVHVQVPTTSVLGLEQK